MKADVVVLGMGPGGEDVATELARAGLDVVGVEKELLGGECPYWACIPTKMMVRATGLAAEGRRIPGMAGEADVCFNWDPVARRIRDEATNNWDDRVAVERFEGAGGRFMRGEARLDGPKRVVVGNETIDVAKAVVVATGTRPAIPNVDGIDQVDYWTNRGAVAATEVPDSLVVIGGGPVGCEFAQIFARAGSQVTLLEGEQHLLPREEVEACQLLHDVFAREDIEVRAGSAAAACSTSDSGIEVTLKDGTTVSGDRLLVATGRRADLDAVGAATIGIDVKKERWLPVDDHLRVKDVDGVWAIGDVAGGGFTHMAMHHARIAVADILGNEAAGASPTVPRVTFTDPEVGAAGRTERQARKDGLNVRTGTALVPKSARGWIHKAGNDGFIKLVEDADRHVLVGATSVGPVGGEVLAMLTLAIHASVPIADLRHMVYAYPTFHRAVEDALKDLDS